MPDAPERDLAKRPANEPSISTVVPSSFSLVFVNDSSNLPLLAMGILTQPSGTPPPMPEVQVRPTPAAARVIRRPERFTSIIRPKSCEVTPP